MSERPILFNAEMVRAILDGRKTQTRRPVDVTHVQYLGGAPETSDPADWGYWVDDEYGRWAVLARGVRERMHNGQVSIPCPLGQPGDRLWVRETFVSGVGLAEIGDARTFHETCCAPAGAPPAPRWLYRADGHRIPSAVHWRPSIHMPRWASRITLEIADVRVQRVQEITAEEAVAEGVRCHICDGRVDGTSENDCACFHTARNAVPSFEFLWRSIYGADSWAANAWVWAVTFRRLP